MIPIERWTWHGFAAHFCCADSCRFRLVTRVGEYVISTVGAYVPKSSEKYETIGCDRYFETFVFHCEGTRYPDSGCSCPQIDGHEIDSNCYPGVSPESRDCCAIVEAGHMEMCRKYAAMQEAGNADN